MSKRIRDAIQHHEIRAKKPRRPETATGGSSVTVGEEEEELSSCRVVLATARSTAWSTMTAGNNIDEFTPTLVTDTDSSIRWRRLQWICGMGVEDLVLGWFPFSEEDFVGQTCWDDDDYEGQNLLDDIWQIKHIQEIPKANNVSTCCTATI